MDRAYPIDPDQPVDVPSYRWEDPEWRAAYEKAERRRAEQHEAFVASLHPRRRHPRWHPGLLVGCFF